MKIIKAETVAAALIEIDGEDGPPTEYLRLGPKSWYRGYACDDYCSVWLDAEYEALYQAYLKDQQ